VGTFAYPHPLSVPVSSRRQLKYVYLVHSLIQSTWLAVKQNQTSNKLGGNQEPKVEHTSSITTLLG